MTYSTPSGPNPAVASEAQPLLGPRPDARRAHGEGRENDDDDDGAAEEKHIGPFLPVAFTAALAITATWAASVRAYDEIACPDPRGCEPWQRYRHNKTIFAAGVAAQAFSVVSIGVARIWVESSPKWCLYLWLLCRGLGMGILLLGFLLNNIYVAVAGRVFDGLANGNVVQFVLAAVYVRARDHRRFSRLLGASLALSMIGYVVNPVFVALLPGFLSSFAAALVVLGLSLAHLAVFVPSSNVFTARGRSGGGDATSTTTTTASTRRRRITSALFNPIYYIYAEDAIRLPALALLLHNAAQGLLFTAIVVHAVLNFNFMDRETRILFGIEKAVPSAYLMVVLYGIPQLQRMWKREGSIADDTADAKAGSNNSSQATSRNTRRPSTRDFVSSVVCMLAQLVSLPWFLALSADDGGAVYVLVAVASVGLAAPSFVKGYAVSILDAKTSALGALALTESLGSLISPLLFFGFGLWVWQNAIVIIVPSFVGASMLCLIASYLMAR